MEHGRWSLGRLMVMVGLMAGGGCGGGTKGLAVSGQTGGHDAGVDGAAAIGVASAVPGFRATADASPAFAVCGEMGAPFRDLIAVSPDGSLLAIAQVRPAIELWRRVDGVRIGTIALDTGTAVHDLSFASDGTALITRESRDSVDVYRLRAIRDGTILGEMDAREVWAVSPDWTLFLPRTDALAGPQRIGDHGLAWPTRVAFMAGPAAFSSDGRLLVTGTSTSDVVLWDAGTGVQLAHFPREKGQGFGRLALSNDGGIIAMNLKSAGLVVLRRSDGRRWTVAVPSPVGLSDDSRPYVSGDGRLIALHGSANPRLASYVLPMGPDGPGPGYVLPRSQADIDLDGEGNLLSLDGDSAVRVWPADGSPARVVVKAQPGHAGRIEQIAVSLDGSRLCTFARDDSVTVWSVAERKELGKYPVAATASAAALSPSGDRLALLPHDPGADLEVIDLDTGTRRSRGSLAFGTAVAFSPDGLHLAVTTPRIVPGKRATFDVIVLDATDLHDLYAIPDVLGVPSFSLEGRSLVVVSGESVRFHDVGDGSLQRSVPLVCASLPNGCGDKLWARLTADEQHLIVSTFGALQILNPQTGAVQRVLVPQASSLFTYPFEVSGDGALLALGLGDSTQVISLADGRLVSSFSPDRPHVGDSPPTFIPGRRVVATGGGDGVVRLRCY